MPDESIPAVPVGPTGASGATSGGSGGADIEQRSVTGPSGPSAPPRRRRLTGSTHQIISGARRVKGYPVTRDELLTLGGVGLATSAFLGVGANFISRSFDLQANIELSPDVKPEIRAKWETREYEFWIIGIVLLVFAVLAALAGGAKRWSIIKSTEHPPDEG